MKPSPKRTLVLVIALTAFCVVALLSTMIIRNNGTAGLFSKPAPVPSRYPEIESIIGVKLPADADVLFTQRAQSDAPGNNLWIIKTAQAPFTLAQVSTLPGFAKSTDSPTDGFYAMQKTLDKTIELRFYGLTCRWDNQNHHIEYQCIQAADGYYASIEAQPTK